jgi:hypothetical protein
MRNAIIVLFLPFMAALVSAADDMLDAKPADEQVEKERAAMALDLCRKGAREYRLCLDDAKRTELELRPEPVLRWSNPAVGSIHGGVFIWTRQGRPTAVASIFKWFVPRDEMRFEVQSLSAEPLVGILGKVEVWRSTRAGIEYKRVPDAPAPAATAPARLAQMRTISGAFATEQTDRDDGSKRQMRLLTQPVVRYASKPQDVIDGGMFAFVHATDPEVLLMLEAQETKSGLAWFYALARMNSTAFKVTYRDQEVWAVDVLPWGIVLNASEPYNLLSLDHLYPPKK